MTGFSAVAIADEGRDEDVQWAGISRIKGPQWAHLPTLTIGLLGCQVLWSVELSYASPYLLSLGLKKSWVAIVLMAGPLSGLIVQPLIGVLADNSTSSFGRRRPYMIGGSILCLSAMLLLGYTRPVASLFTTRNTPANDIVTIWLAVLSIYCIDFSINAVQAVDRALLVDILPISKQAAGSAWAARMFGIGSIAGFFVGNVDLTNWFPKLGLEQLEILSVIASFLLLSTHAITACLVKEKVLLSHPKSKKDFGQKFKTIFSNLLTLPRIIRKICIIQSFASMAWFPVMFYTTVFVGELHKRASPAPESADIATVRALEAEANRLGSRALLYGSFLSLAANVILPFFVSETKRHKRMPSQVVARRPWIECCQIHLGSLWAVSHLILALCLFATYFSRTVSSATFLITVIGFSSAVGQWAPFALLSEAILSEHRSTADTEDAGSIRLAYSRIRDEQQLLVADDQEYDERRSRSLSLDRDDEHALGKLRLSIQMSQPDVIALDRDLYRHDEVAKPENVSGDGLSAKAGAILGISNVFIVIPQFMMSGLSSIIFAILEPNMFVLSEGGKIPSNEASATGSSRNAILNLLQRQEDGVVAREGLNSIAIIFQFGGLAALIAFLLCWRLARELRHRQ